MIKIDLNILTREERRKFYTYCLIWYDDEDADNLLYRKYIEILKERI